jgi:hypothetical protein
LTLIVGFLGVIGLAHDACRFVITEGCLTRLQNIIAAADLVRRDAERTLQADPRNPLIGP